MEIQKNCTICDAEIELDNGDIQGYFGTDPVAFCIWCLSGIQSMLKHINGEGEE